MPTNHTIICYGWSDKYLYIQEENVIWGDGVLDEEFPYNDELLRVRLWDASLSEGCYLTAEHHPSHNWWTIGVEAIPNETFPSWAQNATHSKGPIEILDSVSEKITMTIPSNVTATLVTV